MVNTRHSQSHPAANNPPLPKLPTDSLLATRTTDALLKKLSALHTALSALPQDPAVTASLKKPLEGIRKELVSRVLLLHKERGVKALTACCLGEILRVYAPEAPYTQEELRDIFQFFFRQLVVGLGKGGNVHEDPWYAETYHLLESLSTVKSVVLVCDLPSPTAEDMLVGIFTDVFTIANRASSSNTSSSSSTATKKVEMFLVDILVALLDETSSVPAQVLEIILAQFAQDSSTKSSRATATGRGGYRLAVNVCTAATDRLQRHVCQYFTDLLTTHSLHNQDSDEESDEPSSKDKGEKAISNQAMEKLKTTHDLIFRIHLACPGILHSVIPILESELRADKVEVRVVATKTLGGMYAGFLSSSTPTSSNSDETASKSTTTHTQPFVGPSKTAVDLYRKYPSTWTSWLARRVDVSPLVRLACVEAVPAMLLGLGGVGAGLDANAISNTEPPSASLESLLDTKLLDPDDKIRSASCRAVASLEYDTLLRHVSVNVLKQVVGRVVDKKRSVRVEAARAVGKVWAGAFGEIENNDQAPIKQFGWIPDELLKVVGVSYDVKSLVEQTFGEYILPLPSDSHSNSHSKSSTSNSNGTGNGNEIDERSLEERWTNRLLVVIRYLSPPSVKAFVNIAGLATHRPNMYDAYYDACIRYNGGIIDADEETVTMQFKRVIEAVSKTFPDPPKAAEDLSAFGKLNEKQLYKFLKTCMDPSSDVRSVGRAYTSLTKRLNDQSAGIVPTMQLLVFRCGWRVVNQSCVPVLLGRVGGKDSSSDVKRKGRASHGHSATESAALTLLVAMAKNAPGLFKVHVGELCKTIRQESEEEGEEGEEAAVVEVSLQALSSLVLADPSVMIDARTTERISTIARETKEWRLAKLAARFLAVTCSRVRGKEKEHGGKGKNREKEDLCLGLVKSIRQTLDTVTGSNNNKSESASILAARIAALVQVARYDPVAFESESERLVSVLVKKVVLGGVDQDQEGEGDETEEWVEDSDVSDGLRAKILAIKALRWRVLTVHGNANVNVLEMATPLLKLLVTILEQEGLAKSDVLEGPKVKARMRLQASVSLLHLATIEKLVPTIQARFLRVACVIQDTCFNVRFLFLQKLVILLQQRKLPVWYNVIPFLTVLDPEEDVKNLASSYVTTALRRLTPKMRLETFEGIFIRLLHLLAHHPDFATGQEDITDMASYVNFYLERVSTPDNVSLLFHQALQGKTVQDAQAHETGGSSEPFYIMCEIGQLLIKGKAESQGWLLPSYPGTLKFPKELVKRLGSAAETKETAKKEFLPAGAADWIKERFNLGDAKERKERRDKAKEKDKGKDKDKEKKRKAPPTNRASGTSKRTRRKKALSDDEEEEEDEDDEDEDEEDKDEPIAADGSDEEADEAAPARADDDDNEEERDEEGDVEMEDGTGAGSSKSKSKAKAKGKAAGGKAAASGRATGSRTTRNTAAAANGNGKPKASSPEKKQLRQTTLTSALIPLAKSSPTSSKVKEKPKPKPSTRSRADRLEARTKVKEKQDDEGDGDEEDE